MNTNNPIIGVTERGDPSINFDWVRKLSTVDGAVIITKNLTERISQELLAHADKCILHASITGNGGTVLEPNLPPWQESLNRLKKLVADGFPVEHVVVRVDPIVPTADGLDTAKQVILTAYENGFRRFRVSIMDHYAHMFFRFQQAGVPYPFQLQKTPYGGWTYQTPDGFMEAASELFRSLKAAHPDIVIEACAEKDLHHIRHCGCVSPYDLQILGLPYDDDIDAPGYQRTGCMCYSGKKELLSEKARCPYKCLYCFWKDVPAEEGES